MKPYKIEATIATGNYSNIRPVFEVESKKDEEDVLKSMKRLWERFGESPLKDKVVATTKESSSVEVTTFTGEKLMWNETDHIYTDMEGNVMLSGSKYASMHSPKFDLQMMLPKTANAWKVDEEELRGIWKMNSDISLDWGNAIHQALEIYHKYQVVGGNIQDHKELEANYVLPKQPFLRATVVDFLDKFGSDALPEVVISDVKNKMAGAIDRLEIIDEQKKICRVGDYKTNAVMDKKKMLTYQKQLSFYAHILINHGWTVQSLDLFHLDHENGWVKTEMEVLDLE